MLIKDILGYDTYQFNQYIHELAAILQNDTQTIVLCNLLNKFCNYTDATVKTHPNGKQYHFYHSQKDIFSNELFINKLKYMNAIKCLKEKGYLETFSAKQQANKLLDITYFLINVDKIKESFQQGYKLIHKTEPQPLKDKEPKQSPVKKQQTSKLTAQQQAQLAKIENDYKANFIDEETYNMRMKRITNIDNNSK